jgi:hypothetical protein
VAVRDIDISLSPQKRLTDDLKREPVVSTEAYLETTRLEDQVDRPDYGGVLRWMTRASSANVSYDFWARGNYMRHLLWQRTRDLLPIHVGVRTSSEVLKIYRRLALLGLPVEFLYVGDLPQPKYVYHVCPSDFVVDAGWGYLSSATAYWKRNRRRYMGIAGIAQLMPEAIVKLLANELAEPFKAGEVIIAPAILVGIDVGAPTLPTWPTAQLTDGSAVTDDLQAIQVILNLDLPYVDGLSLRSIYRLRREYDPELSLLRTAISKLLREVRSSGGSLGDVAQELAVHITELRRSAKYARFQRDILKMGGAIGVLTASLGALSQQTVDGSLQGLAVAGATAASVALVELLKQARENRARLAENSYYPLWQLGLRHERDLRFGSQIVTAPISPAPPAQIPRVYHWLAPPSAGCKVAFVQDKSGGLRRMSIHEWYALTKYHQMQSELAGGIASSPKDQ